MSRVRYFFNVQVSEHKILEEWEQNGCRYLFRFFEKVFFNKCNNFQYLHSLKQQKTKTDI